jgi:hypothetical protein
MLDLPQPLGPTTPTSCPGSKKLVGSANDLKPESLMELRRTAVRFVFGSVGDQIKGPAQMANTA